MTDRLDAIKDRWSLDSTLPRPVPWGMDDVVWLVGEIERLRAEAQRADDAAYAVCEKLADWWHKHGIEGTPETDEIAWAARGVVFKKKGPEKP